MQYICLVILIKNFTLLYYLKKAKYIIIIPISINIDASIVIIISFKSKINKPINIKMIPTLII